MRLPRLCHSLHCPRAGRHLAAALAQVSLRAAASRSAHSRVRLAVSERATRKRSLGAHCDAGWRRAHVSTGRVPRPGEASPSRRSPTPPRLAHHDHPRHRIAALRPECAVAHRARSAPRPAAGSGVPACGDCCRGRRGPRRPREARVPLSNGSGRQIKPRRVPQLVRGLLGRAARRRVRVLHAALFQDGHEFPRLGRQGPAGRVLRGDPRHPGPHHLHALDGRPCCCGGHPQQAARVRSNCQDH